MLDNSSSIYDDYLNNNLNIQYQIIAKFKKGINLGLCFKICNDNITNSNCQYILGLFYKKNIYVPQDLQKAFYFFHLSAKQGNSFGQYYLGRMYEKGLYVEKNLSMALNLYILSWEQYNSYAEYILGKIFLTGKYKKIDISFAFTCLKSSSEQGNIKGIYYLGLMFYNGIYVSQDYNKTKTLFLQIQEFRDTKKYLAIINEYQKNYKEAIKYYKQIKNFDKIKELTQYIENIQNKKLEKIFNHHNCVICLNEFLNFPDAKITIRCGHSYHYNCIIKCENCPLCKEKLLLT